MKKLEDIPKKEIFTVPDGYFEMLPGVIQSRIAEKQPQSRLAVSFGLRYALPVVVLLAIGAFWYTSLAPTDDAETILSAVDTESLVAYLDESEISTDELLDIANLDNVDAEGIEAAVYTLPVSDEDADDLMNDLY